MGVLTVADGMALELLVGAYFEWRDARALIRDAAELQVVEGQQVETKDGLVYRSFTENGVILRTHPANSIASDAWRRIGSMLREFGLTPSSRTKVSTTASPADENPWAALVGQGAG
jgi:P27 family predicted phage terminase small subunit